MPLFRQLGGKDGRVSVGLCLYLGALRVFPILSLSVSSPCSLSPSFAFPHAASQTALITAPFEAVFQNENEEKAEVTESSRLNFLQLLAKCTALLPPKLCQTCGNY